MTQESKQDFRILGAIPLVPGRFGFDPAIFCAGDSISAVDFYLPLSLEGADFLGF